MIAAFAVWNASLVEMLWTAIGLVGLHFVLKQVRRTSQYIESTREFNGHNLANYRELRLIAYGRFRNSIFRLAKTLTILLVGTLSMLIPNQRTEITPTGVAITIGLFVIELLIVVPGILDERQAQMMHDDKTHAVEAGRLLRRRSGD